MDAILNTVTAVALVAGMLAFLFVLAFLANTFGRDALGEHMRRVAHRRAQEAVAAQRADDAKRTADWSRRNLAGGVL